MSREISSRPFSTIGAAVLAAMSMASAAEATEGYFQHGYGARHKALGGAGVADSRDSTAISLNPAGLVHSGNEVTAAVSAFSPRREFEGGPAIGPTFTPVGTVESDSNWFAVPNFAASYRLAPNPFADVIGVSVYGSGGMNTDYPAVARGGGATGIFFGGPLGVDLQQALLSVSLAKTIAPGVSVGVAPILARQQIKLKGLDAFRQGGFSIDPNAVTGKGHEVSWGFGVRGGIEVAVAPNIRLGIAGNTPIWSQEFDKYRGLFAEQGDFDIPASIQAGIAVDVTPNLTLLADYRHIWFGSIASIANPSTNLFIPAQLGADNGPGFGWDDVDVVKFGVEWRSSPDLTLRAGYAYATNPISSRDVQFNILAPAVVQHHITAGLEYKLDKAWSIELAGLYAPEETVRGTDLPGLAPANHTVDISMYQFEATFGVKYKFGADEAPLK
ncbi:outer membrane protein transport protein [Hyphomicrobium sp.]|uniref:OmpP1/FadL family transporter n=1 Tax=Hyphomicrobium sp. TaxID=82 RepID=UPI0025C225B0|nr:outer membrane protein transport protein [Hyphomicrobium sp.]MCC7252571.1 outer membrane protein transport protein [Hyphomicrobium sp.]